MHLLLVGHSDIARRRVLPALAACGVTAVDVASRSASPPFARPASMAGIDYRSYETAVRESAATLVWISTTNDLHARLAAMALDAGRHVVLDKPATVTLGEAESLARLAAARRKLLAEATVYAFHPQIDAVRRFFADAGTAPTQLVAAFSFPPLPASNFRRQAALGGGAELDLGPYAMSAGRLFFDAAPEWVLAHGLAADTGFSLVASYPGGRTLSGHFGATTGYVNRLQVLGPRATATIDRAFTTAPDAPCRIAATLDNTPADFTVPGSDSFAAFWRAVCKAAESGETGPFCEALLADARSREQLASALAAATTPYPEATS